jgi:hypothetical protein
MKGSGAQAVPQCPYLLASLIDAQLDQFSFEAEHTAK